MEKTYHSHYREKDQQYQLNVNHQINVARLAENYCPLPELKKTAWLTGIHHDDGKYPEEWQEYFEKSLKEEGFQIFTDKDKANQAVKKASAENRNIIKEK